MNIWEKFGTFYQSLDIGSLVVVWLFLFIFLFFVVATFLLFSKNKELGRLLQEKTRKEAELEAEKRALLEKKIDKIAVKDLDKDVSTVKEKSEVPLDEKAIFMDEDVSKNAPIEQDKKINKMENIDNMVASNESSKLQVKVEQDEIRKNESLNSSSDNNKQVSKESVSSNNNLYNRNNLKDNHRFQTSPINIVREETLDETMQKLKPVEIGETKDDVKNDNVSFVEEISKKMEKEIKPQTIELTDYELKQEQEAIISYDELMKNKDRLFKITDDEEDDAQFIEELKYFRNSLQ